MQLQVNVKDLFDQVADILTKDIPEQEKNLMDNVINLEKVAQYCEDIYVNSKDQNKSHLLNETRSYTTQALASVAYQIHILANSFLHLLDNNSLILNEMGNSMSNLAHEVNIHKEKIARREIGVLTLNKTSSRTVKVKRPEIDEKPVKYVRKTIDYSLLDDVGHGVKLGRQMSDPMAKMGIGRQNSYSSTHSSSSIGPASQAVAAQTPPLNLKASAALSINSGGGLSTVRSTASGNSSYYRTPVVPPSVPSEYLSRQELGIYSSKKELGQSQANPVESTYASYGGPPSGYPARRASQAGGRAMGGQSEYADTLDRRLANAYIQDLSQNGQIYGDEAGRMG